jgi:hypothetical protein
MPCIPRCDDNPHKWHKVCQTVDRVLRYSGDEKRVAVVYRKMGMSSQSHNQTGTKDNSGISSLKYFSNGTSDPVNLCL